MPSIHGILNPTDSRDIEHALSVARCDDVRSQSNQDAAALRGRQLERLVPSSARVDVGQRSIPVVHPPVGGQTLVRVYADHVAVRPGLPGTTNVRSKAMV
ncbi:hypothetical protein [Halomicrococcus gelatinilyticus]|uniref:hypothetical protein n=1 Tax=Halomicrococcus gelatinilyticus TaxID=1702103 RepID=UPI002E11537E